MTMIENAMNLALVISQSIEDDVHIENSPRGTEDFAILTCEDEDGRAYVIKVIQMDVEDAPVEIMSDYGES